MSPPAPGVPLILLAGSDRRQGTVPAEARNLRFLKGYKGADLKIQGRPLAECLLERVRESRGFAPVYLAGPERIFGSIVDCEVIDTDGHVGENIRAGVDFVLKRHGPRSPVGIMACDILPRADEIQEMVGLLLDPGAHPGETLEVGLAMSLIRADRDLGASSWKPRYGIRPTPSEAPVPFLPSHLGIAWPHRLRLGLLFKLLRLAYRERNRDYSRRQRTIFLRIIGALLARDFSSLLRFRPPIVTYMVLRYGLSAFSLWRRGELDLDRLCFSFGAVFVKRKYLRRWGSRCVRLVTSDSVAFAKDIDTEEELRELETEQGP